MWLFYIPVAVYLIILTVRHRGLSFLAVNPGMRLSGVIGDNKVLALAQLQQRQLVYTARYTLIKAGTGATEAIGQLEQFMRQHSLCFPVVLKPNQGQRGQGVAVIRDQQQALHYWHQAQDDTLVQEHIGGLEFGIFYYRYPGSATGSILSITEKQFPVLTGDGTSTVERLILQNPRTHYMAHFLLTLHADSLHTVVPAGVPFQTVEIGSHCRGSLFLDANHLKTDALVSRFDALSDAIDGFCFGRYDVRVPSVEALQNGEQIKVLEVNGVTSEATHIYDPQHSVLYAYKTLFEQWRIAYTIGHENIRRNLAEKTGLWQLFYHLKHYGDKTDRI